MSQISNFPNVEDSWSPSYGANGGAVPASQWVDLTTRTRYQTSIKRGKQYELDQVQAGELQITLNNTDGALDPLNSAGPWGGQIRPFQPFKHRVQSAATVNRLSQAIASGGEGYTAGTIPSSFGISSGTDSTGGSIVVLGSGVAFEESNAFQFSVPAASAGFAHIMSFDAGAIAPGQTYTFSAYVRNVTAGVNVVAYAAIGWYGNTSTSPTSWASGTMQPTLVGSTTAGWTRITVTGTAPSQVYGATLVISLPSGGQATACNVQADGLQLEFGSSASAWVYPGYWYGQFAGFVERWTPQYQDAGTRAEAAITAVDAFALFSQRTLNDALTEEIKALNPRFIYRFNDPQGSTTATDSTGTFAPAPVSASKYGGAPYAFGTAITATNAATGRFYSSDTTLALSNPSPGVDSANSGTNVPASYVQLNSAGIKGPASPALWTRVIAFKASGTLGTTNGATNSARLWSSFDNAVSNGMPSGANIQVFMSDTNMSFQVGGYYNYYGNSILFAGASAPTDGNWHLAVFGIDANGGQMLASLDGVTASAYLAENFNVGSQSTAVPNGLVSDSIGSLVSQGAGNWTDMAFAGDVAFACEFPTLLTSSQVSNLYTAWRNAGTGDSTDQRYARILRYIGYNGGTWLDSGSTRSMGPADFSGSDALSALQAVVDTETGSHWIQGSGTVRFRSRAGKYKQLTPTLTFGEGPGEVPYEDLQLDFDPTHLANVVQVTQTSTGQVFTAQDQTSITNYFTRPLTRSANTTSAAECTDCANYLLSRYKNPLMRVSAIKVNVSANTSLWASLLPLELGARIRVMRRPLGCPPIQVDCFVEQIQWDYDSAGKAELTMQLSPADPVPSAIFAGWHGILAASASAGQAVISISSSGLDNTQPLAAFLGVNQQLTLEIGTGNSETVTVKSVAASSSGWTSCNVTLTGNLAHTHASGSAICEALTAPATDPTAWNLAAVANSINFAY